MSNPGKDWLCVFSPPRASRPGGVAVSDSIEHVALCFAIWTSSPSHRRRLEGVVLDPEGRNEGRKESTV
jgi:hypothetical protein